MERFVEGAIYTIDQSKLIVRAVIGLHKELVIVQLSKGFGPRALDQFVQQNFEHAYTLLNRHNSAVMTSLVVLGRTTTDWMEQGESMRIYVTARALIKGQLKEEESRTIEAQLDLPNILARTRIQCIDHSPSNSIGGISLVDISSLDSDPVFAPKHKLRGPLARQFRKHCRAVDLPILGAAQDAHPFRGHKLLCCIVQLRLLYQNQSYTIHAKADKALTKLAKVLEKERHYASQRHKDNVANNIARAYETQRQLFCGLPFLVSPAVMVPRPGSAALVERVRTLAAATEPTDSSRTTKTILDLGTGSGCLLIAILNQVESEWEGVGVDCCDAALRVAKENARRLLPDDRSIQFHCGTFDHPFPDHETYDRIDIVVANPPYRKRSGKRPMDLVSFELEPHDALFVGDDWTIHYRSIVTFVARQPCRCQLVLEVCKDNCKSVEGILQKQGLTDISVGTDTKGQVRTMVGVWNGGRV